MSPQRLESDASALVIELAAFPEAAAFPGRNAASSITSALGLTLFQRVPEWKQDFAAQRRRRKNQKKS